MSSTVRHVLETKGNDVWTIGPDETVFEALRIMAEKRVGALLVTQGEQLIGIISERDYARKVILEGKTSRGTLVREIMSDHVITIHPSQTVHECMELMTNKRIRHLPVIADDKDEKILGVVSIGDVIRVIMYEQREKIKSLESKLLNQ
ncbi:MAG: CBS domain-containing protein [Chloroflexota bacterium]